MKDLITQFPGSLGPACTWLLSRLIGEASGAVLPFFIIPTKLCMAPRHSWDQCMRVEGMF